MAKSEKKPNGKKDSPEPIKSGKLTTETKPYEPSELVIKEVMVQKSCSRERAIEILKNPTK